MAQLKSTNITGNLSVTGEIVEQGEKIKDKYTLKTYVDSLTGEDIYTDSNETSTIKAALDSLGSSITKKLDSTTAASTYEKKANAITGLSVSGKTITYTKGSGTTGTITTQDTTYSQATSSTAGLVKIGYTESGKNYPVELNSSGQMYVNVPWTSGVSSSNVTQAIESALSDYYADSIAPKLRQWWRVSANLRGTNNSNKTITYSNTLYSFANGNVASSSNMPKAGDFIIDTYGSIYVVVSATTTNCTATQRWMSAAPWKCLEEGTLITLSDGTQKTIENIRQGDLILGYDFEKNKTTEAVALVCTATVEQDNTNYLVFSNGEYLSCTTDHEIYSSTHKKYMFIRDLKEGDKTLNEKGEETEIYSIHRWICGLGYKRFYQLVSSNNTYYANNILNAMHPINKFNWLSYSAQQTISQEIMDIFKADAEEFSCYEFLVKDKDFLKQSVSYQSNIKTRQNKIAELKNRLLETDYIAIKKSEGLEVDEAIIIERQKARDEINKLEEEINTIYQPAYNDLLVSHSTIGEDILLSNEEKRSKYFFKACKRDNENLETFKKYYCNK